MMATARSAMARCGSRTGGRGDLLPISHSRQSCITASAACADARILNMSVRRTLTNTQTSLACSIYSKSLVPRDTRIPERICMLTVSDIDIAGSVGVMLPSVATFAIGQRIAPHKRLTTKNTKTRSTQGRENMESPFKNREK